MDITKKEKGTGEVEKGEEKDILTENEKERLEMRKVCEKPNVK